MSTQRKPISAQVIVITGATSRIGMSTARMAARQGARLVLAASDAYALDQLAGDIRRAGGDVLAVRVDPAVKEQVAALGRAAVQRYGGIDTWVNHVAHEHDGALAQADLERRFKTEYWATVHGTIAARALMKQDGGAIVNLDSDASAKHDVKSFTDALRAEIDTDGVPISVTLVQAPGSGKSAPQQVAEAILYAARNTKPEVRVRRAARAFAYDADDNLGLLDRVVDLLMPRQAHTPRPG
jgi:short-subunit dehydrogenase